MLELKYINCENCLKLLGAILTASKNIFVGDKNIFMGEKCPLNFLKNLRRTGDV